MLDRYRERFQHVLVDEYQDTNRCSTGSPTCSPRSHRNLCVVGDDDQSIYRWRGAEIAQHPRLRARLPRRDGHPPRAELPLDRHHPRRRQRRDRAQHAAQGQDAVDREPARREGHASALLDDDLDEARFVAREIEPARAARARAARDRRLLPHQRAVARRSKKRWCAQRIPYVMVGGVKFFARAEVKDVLAYLRVLVNPADALSAKRIINVPARGIGATTVERIAALEDGGGRLPRRLPPGARARAAQAAAAEQGAALRRR